jgi:nickel/cobalt exporter
MRIAVLLGCCAVTAIILCDSVLAQTPFDATRPAIAADGATGWLFAKQAEFYRALSGALRAAKADGSAVWGLLGLSFLYGMFHAAGPGHGKAVISSYLVANQETWRRGVILSFASALLQAFVAVVLVGIAAILLGVTARGMGVAVRYIEMISYALIAAIGARLVWIKGRAAIATLRDMRAAQDRHAHRHRHGHDHHHDHHHDRDGCCGHAHGPDPAMLAGPGGWRRGLAAIVAVGLRPCSGAILVLVFALAQGIFWAGVAAALLMGLGTAITVAAIASLAVGAQGLARHLAATRPGAGLLVMRGIEVVAALLVLIFGFALLAGYMASEAAFVM